VGLFYFITIDIYRTSVYCISMVRVNYHLTDKQISKLKEMSKDTGLSVAELIRRAVDKYMEVLT
jgi:catalase (peroxidase I)